LGAPNAITAPTHKLARLVYSMLKHGTDFADAGQEQYEERYRSRVVQNLKRRAQELEYKLVSIQEEPQTI
jgi:transposase